MEGKKAAAAWRRHAAAIAGKVNGEQEEERCKKTAGHATTSGQDYEVALLCLVFLRALRLASDFFLLSNHALARKFDDVVLFYRLRGDREYAAILVQAKHRETPARKRLTASNPFQLKKHSDSFAGIGDLCAQPVKVHGQEIEVTEVSTVLYTNTGCDFAGVARDVTTRPEAKNVRDFLGTGGRLLRVSDARRLGLTREFVDRLTLCVEQMSVETSDEHPERELGDLLGLTSPSAVARDLLVRLKERIKRWWSERGPGRCLTAESREWKEVLEERVARLNGVDDRPNLRFTREALAAVRSVIGHGHSWIRVADERQATVTRLRLVRALGSSCLVLEAGFLVEGGRWGEVAALWGTTTCPSLVVDLSASSPEEFHELLERLRKDVAGHSGRRLGVIAREEPPERRWTLYRAKDTWSVLHPVTRNRLMSARVDLQGHVLPLRDVVGGDDDASGVMSDQVISALCDPAAGVTQLGVALDSSSSPQDDYVPQCLQRTAAGIISYKELKTEKTLVFGYNSFPSKVKNNYAYNFFCLRELQRTNHIARTTFVLGEISDFKIRQQCCRLSARGVSENVGPDEKVTEFVPFPWLCRDKVIVVEGVPGVGKSTFVTTMCSKVKQEFPESWVLRFDLAKQTALIKGRHFGNPGDVTAFLLSGLPREQQRGLQRHLLEHSLHVRGNVFLFLDAFDEISPRYTAQCCRLLKGIASQVKFQRMVVTTRSVTSKELEQVLGTKAFSLPVFSEEEQNLILERFCETKGLSVDESKISFLRHAAGPVLETPLICRMAADVLLYSEDQNLLRYKHPWIRVLLYKRFVEQTTLNRLAEKLDHPLSVLEETLLESQSKEHLRNLEALAVRKLFPQDQLSNLEVPTNLPDEKLGLVISDGECVDFQHRTFAEFFFGCWLSKHWQKCDQDLLREMLCREGWEFVSATLSWSLLEGFPLHLAVARGEEVHQQSPGTTDAGGRSLLHLAAMTRGSRLLVTTDEDLQTEDKVLGATPIRCAEVSENWEFLEAIIGKGKTLEGLNFLTNERDAAKVLCQVVEQNLTGLLHLILRLHKGIIQDDFFLQLAARKGHTEIVKILLLEKGAVKNMKNEDGWTALTLAANKGHVEIVKILLEKGADPNMKNKHGWTALTLAADNGHVEIVKILLEKGADANTKIKLGWTALMLAAHEGRGEIVNILLENTSVADMKDEDGWTALIHAANEGHVEIVKMLSEKEIDTNAKTENGWTALMFSADKGHFDIVKILLEKGVDANMKTENGWTALMLASHKGHVEIVKILLEKGVYTNHKDENGWTALIHAAYKGHIEIVKILLEKGVDEDVKNETGWTALMFAAQEGHVEIVNLLLENGSEANMKNKHGWTALMIAADNGHLEIVKILSEKGADTNVKNENGWTALMIAANKGHIEIVKILSVKGVDTDLKNENGWTALMRSADKGHFDIVKILLENGVNGNMKDEDGWTALMIAADNGHVETVKLLLENGSDTNMKNKHGWTAFMYAAHLGHAEIVKILSEKGVDANMKNKYGWTAFTLAVNNGHLEIVKILLEKGVDANMKTENGWTALTLAADKGHFDIVKLLLEKGADANMKNKDGWTALMIAANLGHVETVKLLSEKRVDTNLKDENGWTALMCSAANGHFDIVKILLEKGVDANMKTENGCTALMLASHKGHVEIVKILSEKGVDTNLKDDNGRTALMDAANKGHFEIVKILLEKGSDANLKDDGGWTALMIAAGEGQVEIVTILLRKGSDANMKDEDGWTALMIAANKSHVEVEKILLERGADVNVKDEDGWTALMIAANVGHVEVVKILLEKGADINMKDEDGWTALMIAAGEGQVEIVTILLRKGLDANMKDEDGWTALMIAANKGHVEVVKILLERGADVNVKDEDGWTALMIAADNGDVEIVKILLEKGADANVNNKNGRSALLVAANEGHSKVAKLLLQRGADPKAKDKYGNTSLIFAARCGNLATVKLLLEKGVDPNVQNKFGNTAMLLAAGQGHAEVVKALLDKEVKLNAQNVFGFTALMMAAVEGHAESVKELLDKGARLNAKDKFGNTALEIAALQGHQGVVEVLEERSRNQIR